MTVRHRIRDHAGLWAMLAALVAVAAFLVTAAPRVVSRTEDAALRQAIAESPSSVRDLTVVTDLANPDLGGLADERDNIADRLPPILRRAVQQRWYAVQAAPGTGVADYFPDFDGAKPKLDVRVQDGFAGAVTLVDGELPGAPQLPPTGADALPVEAVVSAETAAALRLRVGSTFQILGESSPPLQVRISGVFRANDPAEPIWQDHPQSLHPAIPRPLSSDPPTYLGTVLLHPEAIGPLTAIGWPSEVSFRYRLDERRLHADQTGELAAALGQLATGAHGVPDAYLDTGLDHLVTQFQARRAAVAAVVAVVLAGLLGALIGVLLLAVRLAAERRREELRLWRARGASLSTVAGTLAAECALPVLPAALLGWGLAMAYPSRAGGVAWPVLAIAAVAIVGLPWFAVPPLRRAGVVAVRGEAAMLRPSLRRLTAELTVLLLAVAGVVLLRRRSLYAADGTDPYLSAVPMLLGLAVALLALRLYPWPLRLAGRLAARLRGAVNFVGLARAGRTAPAVALPLVVLVIAISVGVFSGLVRGTIAEGRDRAAWWPLGGDVRVQGVTFDAGTTGALAAVPGVRQVAPMALSSTALYSERDTGGQLGKMPVLAVDAVAYQRVLNVAGTGYRLPAALTAARRGDGPLPALVSRQLADRLRAKHADGGRMALGSRATDFRVAGVVDRFPGLPLDAKMFAVVPLQAVPEASRLRTTDFAIAGTAIDLPRLGQVATERQHAAVARTSELAAMGLKPPTVRSRAALRDAAERDRLDSVLTVAFTAGAVGAAAITLLAVGFAIVVSARARGRVVSRLRTLGLSQRGARALLIWEVTPLIGVAALAGTALGAGLPWLVGPALGLERFMSGAPPRFVLDPYAVAALAGLVAVALVAAIGLEAAVNRRRNLGGVLRVGEDE